MNISIHVDEPFLSRFPDRPKTHLVESELTIGLLDQKKFHKYANKQILIVSSSAKSLDFYEDEMDSPVDEILISNTRRTPPKPSFTLPQDLKLVREKPFVINLKVFFDTSSDDQKLTGEHLEPRGNIIFNLHDKYGNLQRDVAFEQREYSQAYDQRLHHIYLSKSTLKNLQIDESELNDVFGYMTVLKPCQTKLLELDTVSILIKNLNFDRAEQLRFSKQKLLNRCIFRGQPLSIKEIQEKNVVNNHVNVSSSAGSVMLQELTATFRDTLRSDDLSSCLKPNSKQKRKKDLSESTLTVGTMHISSSNYDTRVQCGIVTENTKICFRSLSSAYFLVVQFAKEMWNPSAYREINFERCIKVIENLFTHFEMNKCSHEIRVIASMSVLIWGLDAKSEKLRSMCRTVHPEVKKSIFQDADIADFYEEILVPAGLNYADTCRYVTSRLQEKFTK